MTFENPEQIKQETDPAVEEEALLADNLDGLQGDIDKVDPDKLTAEDAQNLRAKGKELLELLGGLSGMGIGALEAARLALGSADSPAAIIAAIGFTVAGGLKLLAQERSRQRNAALPAS